MKISVDIAASRLAALDYLASRRGESRAALICRAIDELLARNDVGRLEKAFGLWADRALDGVAYQKLLRDEW